MEVSDVEKRGSLPPGAVIGGRFQVERLIGRGGMGEVYAARHATTGREVALKLIHTAAGSGEDHVRRFMREARAATAIQHPNVIEVFDVFVDADGTPVMVMELLKGEPFSAYRARVGALELHEAARLLLPAARALRAAHDKGVVHRDLKPDNIFLAETPAGRTTKVLDFGIAKVLDPTRLGSETQGQHTNTGSILGTPHYMSYEQAMSDKHVDQRTDVWAMGVILFEALTGRRPLVFDTLGQMYTSFLQGNVPSIREYVPAAPDDFAAVLDACLAKLQGARLSDLGKLVDVLEKYSDPAVPGARTGGRVVAAPVSGAVAETPTPLTTGAATATAIATQASARKRRQTATVGAIALLAVASISGAAFVLYERRVVPTMKPTGESTEALSSPASSASSVRTEAASTSAGNPPPAVEPAPSAVSAPVSSVVFDGGAAIVPRDKSAAPGAGTGAGLAAGHRPPTSAAVSAQPPPASPPVASTAKKGISDKLPY
jgi:serine/threonine-protein kinase